MEVKKMDATEVPVSFRSANPFTEKVREQIKDLEIGKAVEFSGLNEEEIRRILKQYVIFRPFNKMGRRYTRAYHEESKTVYVVRTK